MNSKEKHFKVPWLLNILEKLIVDGTKTTVSASSVDDEFLTIPKKCCLARLFLNFRQKEVKHMLEFVANKNSSHCRNTNCNKPPPLKKKTTKFWCIVCQMFLYITGHCLKEIMLKIFMKLKFRFDSFIQWEKCWKYFLLLKYNNICLKFCIKNSIPSHMLVIF